MAWVKLWRRRLPFENEKSRLYIKPAWRNFWIVIGATMVAVLDGAVRDAVPPGDVDSRPVHTRSGSHPVEPSTETK